ncbi:MAG: 7,8-dihydroneopterin aldolase/epimerase/oxygenase [Chloroflexota bacterium]|nr:7,8-dihydroneopterin aldolase/epimerase/oxygenase [Chloroflexota bacterium]
MTDRIVLRGMRFEGRHGVSDEERELPQEIEVDVEVETDLTAAGKSDDLADTINYAPLVKLVRRVVEDRSFKLLEGIAGTIADEVLATTAAAAVLVRVRKLAVPIDADLDFAGVEIRRPRTPG